MRGELGVGSTNIYAELPPQHDLATGSVLMNVIGVAAMEYRYDGSGRQRYMVRPRMADEDLQPIGGANAGAWHDFAGDEIYGTYGITIIPEVEDPPAPASLDVEVEMSYLAGVGYDDMNMHTPTSQPVYGHSDQIGTIRRLTATDPATTPSAPLAARATYTAFGEVYDQTEVPGTNANVSFRAGYAGAWGYQSGEPDTVTVDAPENSYWGDSNDEIVAPCDPMTELGWLHVGERYYDPACGRFVMRDPIGIKGGINTYEYVGGAPTDAVDPQGLWTFSCGFDATAMLPVNCIQISFTANFGWSRASGFSCAPYFTYGGGPGFGLGVGAGLSGTITNADNVGMLAGDGIEIIGSAGSPSASFVHAPGYVGVGGGYGLVGTTTGAAVMETRTCGTSVITDKIGNRYWMVWDWLTGGNRPPGYRPY